MITFPISTNTFKKAIIDGNGEIKVVTTNDAWGILYDAGKSFDKSVKDDLAQLELTASKDFKFGHAGKLSLSVGVSGELGSSLRLIWPGDDDELIKTYKLGDMLTGHKLCMALLFNAKADLKTTGAFPVGPLKGTFGISAGGNVAYERLRIYDDSRTVKDILTDVFAGVRLPHSADTLSEIPAEGEVLALRYGGYLKLNAGLSWGYSLTGTRSFEIRDLSLDLDYALKLMAEISIGYRLAGDFNIEVRRGTTQDWIRVIVRKSRESEFNFAADFGFEADFDLKGLPGASDEFSAADEFLSSLLGTNARTFLRYFNRIEKYSNLDELEKEVGKLSTGFLQKLSNKWLQKALDDNTLQEFLGVMHRILEEYNDIDKHIIGLYQDYLDKPAGQLTALLDRILGNLQTPDDLLNLADPEISALLRKVWNERIHELLLDVDEFKKFRDFIQQTKDFIEGEPKKRLREFIEDIKKEFPLNDLFKELEKYDTADELKTLADEKLQDLVGRIIGTAFDELKNSDFGKAAQNLQGTLGKIQDFKTKWYEKLNEAVKQSFKFDLHYAYTRANKDESLLDIEINLKDAGGQALMDAASNGDFSKALSGYSPERVLIRKGVFTHSFKKSAQLQVNVLGWGSKSLVELVQETQDSLEVEPSGLMHVYTLDTYIEQRKENGKKFKEVMQSNFLLGAVGATFRKNEEKDAAVDPKVIEILRKMSVQYDLLQEDDRTDARELTQYLELAEMLGLIPSRERVVEELNSQFRDGLGKVKIDYVVRYDDEAVRSAFTLSGSKIRDFARQTARHLIAAKFIEKKQLSAYLAFAYLGEGENGRFYDIFNIGGDFPQLSKNTLVRLPAWYKKMTGNIDHLLDENQRRLLKNLFMTESNYAERLVKLDETIDKLKSGDIPVPVNELAENARKFVDMADNLDKWRENTFFAIFDKLVKEGGSNKGRRESTMIMEITPPGAGADKKVTKYFMS